MQMEADQVDAYINSCKENPGDNIFCFSVLNKETLDEKAKDAGKPSHSGPGHGPSYVLAKFRHHHLINWESLRSASVSAILRGIQGLKPSEFRALRQKVVQENGCPNNAAIAVAASLEDLLPDGAGAEEIGKLYEKGAQCLGLLPADKETLLTRAGLFFFSIQNYHMAAHIFARASAVEGAFVARSLYWLYRSKRAVGLNKEAATALRELRTKYPFSFHTLMALTATNRDPGEILSNTEPVHLKRSQQVPDVNTLIEQVEILHRFGFEQSASRVLDWAVADSEGVEPEVKIYLAELKQEQGDNLSKITLLSDVLYNHPGLISRETMEQYFPKVYFPVFEKHSSGVDPYFLLAIARRESAFNPRAISSANARGLLQVMPQTRKKLGLVGDLLDPNANVEIGAKYVQELLKKSNGQIYLVLAAYNAGPQRVTSWTSRYPVSDPVLFIDLIPFRETREYVASVLRNYYWYRRIHQGTEKISQQHLLELTANRM